MGKADALIIDERLEAARAFKEETIGQTFFFYPLCKYFVIRVLLIL